MPTEYIIARRFQSTLLVRGATQIIEFTKMVSLISIHAPRERSDDNYAVDRIDYDISIHAPRERSDDFNLPENVDIDISIHAPRERSDKSK